MVWQYSIEADQITLIFMGRFYDNSHRYFSDPLPEY